MLATIDTMPAAQQSEPAWRYWKARALRQQNRILEANQILAPLSAEHHYYGLLAREDLEQRDRNRCGALQAFDSEIRAMQRPSIQLRAGAVQDGLAQRSHARMELGMRRTEDPAAADAARLAARNNWYDRAIYAAERTVSARFQPALCRPYRDVVSEYAKQVVGWTMPGSSA